MEINHQTDSITPNSGTLTLGGNAGLTVNGTVTFTSPSLSATTQSYTDNSTNIATTAYVQAVFDNDSRLKVQNVIVVKKNANTLKGEFLSIAAACDYVTSLTPSATNLFLIKVGAGIYSEPVINMPQFTSIEGASILTTIIEPDTALHNIVEMNTNCEISFLTIRNAGVGYCGIYANDIGDFAQIHKISLLDNDTHIKAISSTQDTFVFIEYVDINGDYNIGLDVSSNNGFLCDVNAENYYALPTANVSYHNKVSGANALLTLHASTIDGIGGDIGFYCLDHSKCSVDSTNINDVGTCFQIEDGSNLHLLSCNVGAVDYVLYNPNVGDPCQIDAFSTSSTDTSTIDIQIDHAASYGIIQGKFANSKINIASNLVSLNYNDSTTSNLYIVGETFKGRTHNDMFSSNNLLMNGTMGISYGGEITLNSGFIIDISAGKGYLQTSDYPNHSIKEITWSNSTLTLSANQEKYIYINNLGTLSFSSTEIDSISNILLGRVITNSTTIEFIDSAKVDAQHNSNKLSKFLREVFSGQFAYGCAVSENATARHLDVTSGEYFIAENSFLISGGVNINFTEYYRDGLGSWIKIPNVNLVKNAQYDDNSGTLANITTGYYTKHLLYVGGNNIDEKYFLVLGQNIYATQIEAINGTAPSIPTYFKEGIVPIAAIVTQEGNNNIDTIIDIRPRPASQGFSTGGTSDHQSLTGRDTPTGHTWALDVNGSNNMQANLDMNNFAIINSGNINGVSITAHASRHQHGGSDEIATATAGGSLIPKSKSDGKLDSGWGGSANSLATLGADGKIPLTQIPNTALERLVIVADQAARFALTTASVQNGDTVKQTDTGAMYFVSDDTNLNNASGYTIYTAGTASAVDWANITSIPASVTSLSGTNTGDQTNITGNAGTATALQTARNINGVAFDGTADITITAASSDIPITNDTTTNATMFPTWVAANTGSLPVKVTSTKLSFNPSTGILSATGFSGSGANITGTAASLTAGTVTTNANLTGDVTSVGNATTIANLAVTNAKIANATIDLTTKVTGILPIVNGGTNGATQTAAFDNLSPANTLGDMIWHDGTNNVRLPILSLNRRALAVYPAIGGNIPYWMTLGDLIIPPREFWLYEDFTSATNTGTHNWTAVVNGAGASATTATQPIIDEKHHGVIQLSTGTTATGRCTYHNGLTNFVYGVTGVSNEGATVWDVVINIPTLSTAAQEYTLEFGFGGNTGGTADHTNGLYFKYNRLTSTNWIITSSSSGVRTNTTTSTPVTTGWHRFRIILDTANANVPYFIDAVSVGTISTNIPTALTQVMGSFFKIRKTVGTTASLLYLDSVYIWHYRNTASY